MTLRGDFFLEALPLGGILTINPLAFHVYRSTRDAFVMDEPVKHRHGKDAPCEGSGCFVYSRSL